MPINKSRVTALRCPCGALYPTDMPICGPRYKRGILASLPTTIKLEYCSFCECPRAAMFETAGILTTTISIKGSGWGWFKQEDVTVEAWDIEPNAWERKRFDTILEKENAT